MQYLIRFFSSAFVESIAWTIVHSFWQATLITLCALVLLRLWPTTNPNKRYWLFMGALSSVFLLSCLTFFRLYQPENEVQIQWIDTSGTAITAVEQVVGSAKASAYFSFDLSLVDPYLPLIFGFWLFGVAIFGLRMIGSVFYLQFLSNHAAFELDQVWKERLAQLKQQLKLQTTVKLRESFYITSPMVIGFIQPLILLPIGTINGLSTKEVEAILAHELAHIKRNDYLLNLVQTLIEILFYFNPAVWFLSARIREERENCCDDVAVAICGNSLTYAKALLKLQEQKGKSQQLAMNLLGNKHQLLQRIQRILNQPNNRSQAMEKIVVTSVLVLALSFMSVSNWAETTEIDHQDAATEAPYAMKLTHDAPIDSLPKGNIRLEVTKNGQKVDAQLNDGKITKLTIDGKKIPEHELDAYEPMVQQLIDDIPPPPPPPPAPTNVPAPSAPPAPSSVPAPPAPSSVPAPPAPPAPAPPPSRRGSTIVEKEVSDDGSVIISVRTPGTSETVEIEIDEALEEIRLNGEVMGEDDNVFIFEDEDFDFAMPDINFYHWNSDSGSVFIDIERQMEEVEREMAMRQEELQQLHREYSQNRKANMDEAEEEMQEVKELMKLKYQEAKELQRSLKNDWEAFEIKIDDGTTDWHWKGSKVDDGWYQAIENKLIANGLIKDPENYELKLNKDELVIDNQKQPETIHKQYLDLYTAEKGEGFTGKISLHIEKNKSAGYHSTRME